MAGRQDACDAKRAGCPTVRGYRESGPAPVLIALLVMLLAISGASATEETPAARQGGVGAWGAVTNGLQSRLFLERAVFKPDEPILVKVLVRNVTDRPVRYDGRYSNSWQVFPPGPGGRPAPDISQGAQTVLSRQKYEYPTIAPGREVEVASMPLDRVYWHLCEPGKYRVRWEGTSVQPPGDDAARAWTNYFWVARGSSEEREAQNRAAREAHQRALDEARRIAVGLPPVEPVEIEIVRVPGVYPARGVIVRTVEVLPPAWRIDGVELESKAAQPQGRERGSGSVLRLMSYYGGGEKYQPIMHLQVMARRAAEDPAMGANGKPAARYLGKGPYGYVYLDEPSGRMRCLWHHAAYDLAAALEVNDPPPVKPAGPDWGRMISQVLSDSMIDSHKNWSHYAPRNAPLWYFVVRSDLSAGEAGRPLLYYDSTKTGFSEGDTRERAKAGDTSRYLVALSIQPIGPAEPPGIKEADQSIHWDGVSPSRSYRVKRLGVDILLEVRSQDQEFARKLNDFLERALTSVLSGA